MEGDCCFDCRKYVGVRPSGEMILFDTYLQSFKRECRMCFKIIVTVIYDISFCRHLRFGA